MIGQTSLRRHSLESAEGLTVSAPGPVVNASKTNRVASSGPYSIFQLVTSASLPPYQINKDGVVTGGNVLALVYHNHTLFQHATDNSTFNAWWYWNTSTSDAAVGTPGWAIFVISSVGLSTTTYASGATAGTTIATINVAMQSNAAGDTFPGNYGGTLALSGTDAAKFSISGTNLQVASGQTLSTTNQTYNITITASFPAGSGAVVNPVSTQFSLTQAGGATVHYGTSPPSTIANVTGNVSPTGWAVGFFDDFTSFTTAGTTTAPGGGTLPLFTTGATYNGSLARYSMTMASTSRNIGGIEQQIDCDPVLMSGINPYSQSGSVLTLTASVPSASQSTTMQNVAPAGQYSNAASLGGGGPFIAARFCTWPFLRTVNTGYFEINCRLPAGAGMWGQFWIKDDTGANGPTEVDFFEQVGGTANKMSDTTHYANGSQQSNSSQSFNPVLPADTTAGFHTYGTLVCPNYIAWYFDGALVYQTPPLTSPPNMWVIIGNSIGKGITGQICQAAELPQTMPIDWWRYSILGPA